MTSNLDPRPWDDPSWGTLPRQYDDPRAQRLARNGRVAFALAVPFGAFDLSILIWWHDRTVWPFVAAIAAFSAIGAVTALLCLMVAHRVAARAEVERAAARVAARVSASTVGPEPSPRPAQVVEHTTADLRHPPDPAFRPELHAARPGVPATPVARPAPASPVVVVEMQTANYPQ